MTIEITIRTGSRRGLFNLTVGFETLGRPALARLAGDPAPTPFCVRARAGGRIVHHPGRTEIVSVALERPAEVFVAHPQGWHRPAVIATRHADGFAILDASTASVEAGATVCVRPVP